MVSTRLGWSGWCSWAIRKVWSVLTSVSLKGGNIPIFDPVKAREKPAIAELARRCETAKPLGMFRSTESEFLLCYDCECPIRCKRDDSLTRPSVRNLRGSVCNTRVKTAALTCIAMASLIAISRRSSGRVDRIASSFTRLTSCSSLRRLSRSGTSIMPSSCRFIRAAIYGVLGSKSDQILGMIL
jgi:hypothetical protein